MNGRASSDAKTVTNRNGKYQTMSDERKTIFKISSGTNKILPNSTTPLQNRRETNIRKKSTRRLSKTEMAEENLYRPAI